MRSPYVMPGWSRWRSSSTIFGGRASARRRRSPRATRKRSRSVRAGRATTTAATGIVPSRWAPVFLAGNAQFYGSVPGLRLRIGDAIDITPTPDGGGYWVLGTDGGVFAFGDAGFYGSRG
jgi:hypothetical protein